MGFPLFLFFFGQEAGLFSRALFPLPPLIISSFPPPQIGKSAGRLSP